MKTKRNVLIIAMAVLLAVVLSLVIGNHPPRIDALQAEPARVFPSQSTQVTCTASGRGATALDYRWQASGGEIEGDGAVVIWRAPASEGFYYISVNVTDGRGRQASGHIMVTVKANQPPIINSLTADAEWIVPLGSLNVTCGAEDYDDHPLSYQWSATGGNFDGTGPEVTWKAPEDTGIYEITVLVSDDYGGSVTGTLAVSVMQDQPPVIEALQVRAGHKYLRELVSGERYEVGEGRTFDIECIASHPHGMAISYEWECDTGEISYDSDDRSLVKWTAPFVRGFTSVTVTVSDLAGNMVRQSVTLEVVSCSRFG
jgi:hypothetical protein